MRVIFTPEYNDPSTPRAPLAYVQPFRMASSRQGTKSGIIDLCRVKQAFQSDNSRKGLIIPLLHIWRPVQLIPDFGRVCNPKWTCDSAVELASTFVVDNYFCLSDFIEIYSGAVGN